MYHHGHPVGDEPDQVAVSPSSACSFIRTRATCAWMDTSRADTGSKCGESGCHLVLATARGLAFRVEACLVDFAGHRNEEREINEGLECRGRGVSAVGEQEQDVVFYPGGKAVHLCLAHHGEEGCHVGRVVLKLDR
jgi:hypothetical protein